MLYNLCTCLHITSSFFASVFVASFIVASFFLIAFFFHISLVASYSIVSSFIAFFVASFFVSFCVALAYVAYGRGVTNTKSFVEPKNLYFTYFLVSKFLGWFYQTSYLSCFLHIENFWINFSPHKSA